MATDGTLFSSVPDAIKEEVKKVPPVFGFWS